MKRQYIFLFLGLFFFHFTLQASADEKKFDPGNFIMDHVSDAHDWHILTVGEHDVSIPLPIILYHQGSLHAFMSSRFEHGHTDYKGFRLETEGEKAGKIVCVNEVGEFTGEMPLDFSITRLVASLICSVAIILGVLFYARRCCLKNSGKAPKGMQSVVEMLVIFVRDLAISSIGKKKYAKYLPYLLTLFIFIFFNNLLGLVPFFPGGSNLTGNIAITLVLAIFTYIITTFNGSKHYWVDMFNTPGVPWWLKFPLPIMPLVEVLSSLTKPFVLMVRLFANITAGHIITLSFICLIFIFGQMDPALGYGASPVSVLFGVFMNLLELLVAFIQAYVFTLLSALYIGMAVAGGKHEKEEAVHSK